MRGVSSLTTTTTDFAIVRGAVTPEDQRRIYLFVGFTEYGHALNHFMELLHSSTAEELAAMDEIIAEKPEFTVYGNQSTQLATGPSTIVPAALAVAAPDRQPSARAATSAVSGQRGLAWVVAFARVEYGAMLAGYSDVASPFTAVPLHAFDADAYRLLLLDGAASHYWSLVNDPALRKVTSTSPSNPVVLAYSRRLVVARGMLSAAIRLGQPSLSNIQMRELASWKESMDELQAGLVAKIQIYLTTMTDRAQTSTTKTSKYTEACEAMLRAERREAQR